MKKLISSIIVLLMLMSGVLTFALDVETSVKLNGSYIGSDAKHLLIDDSVFVVARSITEALGGEITWIENTNQVLIQEGETVVLLTIDDSNALVNNAMVELDTAPFIRDGRTYIPLRFVSENLNCTVEWDSKNYTVIIERPDYIVPEEFVIDRGYTDEDLLWLSRIVDVESDYKSYEMKLGIANVVLNRVKDTRFPSSVYDVIFEKNVYTQFPPAHKESFQTLEPSNLSIIASKKALEGVNNVDNCLFFNNSPFKGKDDDLYIIIEGEYFYY